LLLRRRLDDDAPYDLGTNKARREVTRLSGLAAIRLQTLPEQKNRPSVQASTRSESDPCIAIVA
jgi:hypothetical protein